MKQHITVDQLDELDSNQTGKLSKWAYSKNYHENLLLSIGQMIEFLSDNFRHEINVFDMPSIRKGRVSQHELCDFLWESVKAVFAAKENLDD